MSARPTKRWLLLLLVPIVLLGGEAAARVWGAEYDAAHAEVRIASVLAELRGSISSREDVGDGFAVRHSDRWVLHPYVGFERAHWIERISAEVETLSTKRPQEFRVLVVGGSFATSFCAQAAERLRGLLQEHPRLAETNVQILVHARPSCKQPQQFSLVNYLFGLGYEVDAVVNIDGYEELKVNFENIASRTHPAYPEAARWLQLAEGMPQNEDTLALLLDLWKARNAAEALAARARRSGYLASAWLGKGALAKMHTYRDRYRAAQEAYTEHLLENEVESGTAGPPFSASEALEGAVRIWTESSRDLHAICKAHGVTYLHVLEPILQDVESKTLSQQERALDVGTAALVDFVLRGYPELREAGERLKRQGIAFVDRARAFKGTQETVYAPAGALTPRGAELFAESIAPVIVNYLPRASAE